MDNKIEVAEAVENVSEGFFNSKVLAGVAGFGTGILAGVLIDRFVVKPIAKKIKDSKEAKKAAKNEEKSED